MKAQALKKVDEEYNIHLLAFKAFQVQGMRKVGKNQVPVYKTFDKFYDYEKRINKILGIETEEENTQVSRYKEFLLKGR